jgi:hypothetical protein
LNKLKKFLMAAAAGLPLLLLLPNCSFNPSGLPGFDRGDAPFTGAVFCDIEIDRRCSTPTDRMVGIDIARPYEDGFWVGRSSDIGLDSSPAALALCGGQPQAIVFKCAFPNGCPVCLNCGTIGSIYPTTTDACVAYCESQDPAFVCENIARASTGAEACFAGACLDSAMLDPAFQDPREATPTPTPTPTVSPVVWRDPINVVVSGNSLTKTAVGGAWDSGAASTQVLNAGDGYVEFTAAAIGQDRMCGLSIGAPPDNDPNFTGITFAAYLRGDMPLIAVFEGGVQAVLPMPVPYAAGDTIRVAVSGGVVQYSKNGTVFYTSAGAVSYPLRVDASLFSQNATVTDARTSF